ncbi:hypothetical protein K493DRAFT_305865 [Basidiobolus meristosporus CBS 931.73]|uniref:Uncharacterized protein n=1 Tax=Basidiobolus meristosporus CBS 931.73 TaxID=1314790 RepID=A0A1Y1XU92_9FUNG|nr:hypothetical protein K493DRAFT_305865 [Basidiobolus meristosporus CBS 931.73]|eukprot:ORX89331.1 hypothetical protein K493DRAFT_305865 [Basidiobolus meristosporus CBS 931.73]
MYSTDTTIPLPSSDNTILTNNNPTRKHELSQKQSSSFTSLIAARCQGNIEANIRAMDSLFNTNFHEWIRNDRNVHCIALRLRSMVNEYELRQLANVMQWIAAGWPENRCRTLFQLTTANWSEAMRRKLASELLLSSSSTRLWTTKTPDMGCNRCHRPRIVRSMRVRASAPFTYPSRDSEIKRNPENSPLSTPSSQISCSPNRTPSGSSGV